MSRTWVDPRDDTEWTVEAVHVMQRQEPGEPIAMMDPDTPLRVWFRSERQEHLLVAKLPQPLHELPDLVMMSLLDAARDPKPGRG